MDRRIATRKQGIDERVKYAFDVTNWGTSPFDVEVVVYDVTDPTARLDVTTDVTSGSAVVEDELITLPFLQGLTANHAYRVEVKFTTDSLNHFEPYLIIWAED